MIIAITGKKFSGKSTVAEMLGEELGWEVTAFAKKLKEITCILSGCTMEQLEDYNFKEQELVPSYLWPYCNTEVLPTYRNFLQSFGSDVMRAMSPRIWIDSTLDNAPDDVIVSDCRFLNEMSEINERNGVVVRVLRGDISSKDSHKSEVEMESIVPDVTILNTGSLDELRDKVKEFVKDIVACTVKAEY